jgi:hypothetical protein
MGSESAGLDLSSIPSQETAWYCMLVEAHFLVGLNLSATY